MFEQPENTCSYNECSAAFAHLFPSGFAGADVLAEIARVGHNRRFVSILKEL
ncbi:MAG TPA: hypothetical protein VGM03_06045 [Phycisphaerae bacterium]|jgi:hypothetical protein